MPPLEVRLLILIMFDSPVDEYLRYLGLVFASLCFLFGFYSVLPVSC